MRKTVLTFGLASGLLCSLLMAATVPLKNYIGFDRAEYVGYTVMVVSFLLVFFGIRSCKQNVGNGRITFAKACAVGLSITVITCVCYVVTWEIIYFNFLPGFMEEYTAYIVQKAQASGESAAAIHSKLQQLQKSKELYNNLFFNMALTFLEPLPVGLLVTLLSAAVLRKTGPTTSQWQQSPDRSAA